MLKDYLIIYLMSFSEDKKKSEQNTRMYLYVYLCGYGTRLSLKFTGSYILFISKIPYPTTNLLTSLK